MAAEESINLDRNKAAALSYLLGLITGFLMLATKGKDENIHFHAVQSIGLSVIWIGGWLFLTVIPVLGWMFMPFWGLIMFVFWLVSMVKAYQGERFKLPLVGDYIQKMGKKVGL